MKKYFLFTLISIFFFWQNNLLHAQDQMSEQRSNDLWEQLSSNNKINCQTINENDFALLGERFLAEMVGNFYWILDEAIERVHGQDNKKNIYTFMGQSLSGCTRDKNISSLFKNKDWASKTAFFEFNSPYWNSLSPWIKIAEKVGWLILIFWLIFSISGLTLIVILLKWIIIHLKKKHVYNQPALEILKERYAKGEITKKQFEDIKKDLEIR